MRVFSGSGDLVNTRVAVAWCVNVRGGGVGGAGVGGGVGGGSRIVTVGSWVKVGSGESVGVSVLLLLFPKSRTPGNTSWLGERLGDWLTVGVPAPPASTNFTNGQFEVKRQNVMSWSTMKLLSSRKVPLVDFLNSVLISILSLLFREKKKVKIFICSFSGSKQ